MPTYGYRCPACGHDFDKLQKMSDVPGADCPECGEPAERQISGGAGVVFKGSGFYETDYKRAGESKPSSDAAAPDKKESGGDKGKPGSGESSPSKKDAPTKGSDS